jgi:hypothetical protein
MLTAAHRLEVFDDQRLHQPPRRHLLHRLREHELTDADSERQKHGERDLFFPHRLRTLAQKLGRPGQAQ